MEDLTMKTYLKLVFTISLLVAGFRGESQLSAGKLQRIENFQSNYIESRNVDVWLPADYSPTEKYAVLYMHDGQMLFDSTTTWNRQEWGVDETMNELLTQKKIRNCIVVAIWNNGKFRHPEYFPQKALQYLSEDDRSELLNLAAGNEKLLQNGPVADNYLRFLVRELKPYVDQHFSTLTDQQNTFIAGSSMGGLISMYAICEYPEVFGGAACISTHWPGTFKPENNPVPAALLAYMKDYLPKPGNHRIYFDYGDQTLDAWYEPFQLQADEIMRQSGFNESNWLTRKFPGEDHSEKAWKKRLSIPVTFLLQK